MSRHELLDQTPVSLPLRFHRQEPLHVRIMRQVRMEMEARMAEEEKESDAMDFSYDEAEDIEDRLTRYQDKYDFENPIDNSVNSPGTESNLQRASGTGGEKVENSEPVPKEE